MLYLWNWILGWCWSFVPLRVRQSPAFCYSIHPKALIKHAFVRIVEPSFTTFLAIVPVALIPVSICFNTSWKIKFNAIFDSLKLKSLLSQTYTKQISLTKSNDSLPVMLVPHPLSLIDVSTLKVHPSPATPLVLTPLALIDCWVVVKVRPIPLRRWKMYHKPGTRVLQRLRKTFYLYIHASSHFSIHHCTPLHTPLILRLARCRCHIHPVFRISTLRYRWRRVSSKPEFPCLSNKNPLLSLPANNITRIISDLQGKLWS